MLPVAGSYCSKVEQVCARELGSHRGHPTRSERCLEYLAPSVCKGPRSELRFCIDRFEWPNREHEKPLVLVSWQEATRLCESAGKRLCGEEEWTLACEGPRRLSFPYGHVRDSEACNIDKPSPKVNEARLYASATQDDEVARLDQREASGSRARCVSEYGVHDLTGNVDEWVVNETGQPYKSSLKGGNWGEYRNACRPSTLGHDEGFYYYQIGYRCCRDVP